MTQKKAKITADTICKNSIKSLVSVKYLTPQNIHQQHIKTEREVTSIAFSHPTSSCKFLHFKAGKKKNGFHGDALIEKKKNTDTI